ncbi:hypothetical protein [Chitinilyticum piscinae]|uniref:Uncharacterized protein n=1 Tax=Chitinilyticum piscinae TaxID=2866724 RepID=A0A8J7K7T1_9NEIS|nr:hypothetical protein [Chitinilyticum piscinae]MBE9608548.1 hypothetical protein [Chitinilyticum piscinae]
MSDPFSLLGLSCHARKSCAPCVCSDAEIGVRHYASPLHALAPMDTAQRDWCISEIRRYQPEQEADTLVCYSDDRLARAVLKAWTRSVRF